MRRVIAIGCLLAGAVLGGSLTSTAAGGAGGVGAVGAAAGRGGPDTRPPEIFIRARERQEFRYVLDHGVQATCGADERPVTCTMVVLRGQKPLNRESTTFDRPFNRAHFELELTGAKRRRIVRHGPPVELLLALKVVDEAGNVSRAEEPTRLVRDT